MGRGKLRIHLGAAPGVGKTCTMLAEAHRHVERDTDCVVASAETHGRPRTEALLTGMEQVPHRRLEHGGVTVAEMDPDAVLTRRPRVALVDELAHTNTPGSRNAKRRQDVEDRVRETSGMESAALLERAGDVEPWTCAGRADRGRPVERPEDADVEVPVGDHMAPALTGRVPPAEDRRVLAAFAAQAAVVLDRRRPREQADRALALAEGNRIRTALLADVSHDLRTPPAGIKAAVPSLRSEDVAWSDEDRAELLEGIEDGADRLDHLVGNLLDMSRLHTGTVTPLMRGTDLDEVVPRALGGVTEPTVVLNVPETLPMVDADPGLLERAMANVIENSVKYSLREEKAPAAAGALADRVEVRVVDRGPGVPDEGKERIFAPFQRHGDAPRGSGVGLAVARGFTEAMGGTLNAADTPGGGLTMTLTPHAADARPEDGPDDRGRGLVTAQDERRTS